MTAEKILTFVLTMVRLVITVIIAALVFVAVWFGWYMPKQEQKAFEWLCDKECLDINQLEYSCKTEYSKGKKLFFIQFWGNDPNYKHNSVASFIVVYSLETKQFYDYIPYSYEGY